MSIKETANFCLSLRLANMSDEQVKAFCYGPLAGTSDMGNELRYARIKAQALREEAWELEQKTLNRLIETIEHEWTADQILKALNIL